MPEHRVIGSDAHTHRNTAGDQDLGPSGRGRWLRCAPPGARKPINQKGLAGDRGPVGTRGESESSAQWTPGRRLGCRSTIGKAPRIAGPFSNSGGGIRTRDLRVMSPQTLVLRGSDYAVLQDFHGSELTPVLLKLMPKLMPDHFGEQWSPLISGPSPRAMHRRSSRRAGGGASTAAPPPSDFDPGLGGGAAQSLYGSKMSRPAIATPSGRSVCLTRIEPACAARTSGSRL